VQHVLTVDKYVELQQPGNEEEVGVAHHRQPQHAVTANHRHWRPDIDQRGEMESLSRVRCGYAADPKAAGQTGNRETEQQRPRINFAPVECLREKRTAHAPDDNGEESPEFEDPVAPTKAFPAEVAPAASRTGRPEECSLRADEKDRRQRQFQIGSHEGCGGEQHDAHFKHFRPDGHSAFC